MAITKIQSESLNLADDYTFTGTVAGAGLAEADIKTLFNASGSAPVYACRAWVVFDGNTGSITNSGSAEGNVSSVTRFGTGNYRVNFTNAMPDTEYTVTGSTVGNSYGTRETFLTGDGGLKTTGYVNVQVHDRGSSFVDNNRVNVNVVR
jgi:hypothetical protein